MSRVSEALERASAEGAELVSKASATPTPSSVEPGIVQESTNGESNGNGTDDAFPGNLPNGIPELVLPLAKRLQRLIFGRDLDKIKEFPLVFQEKNSYAGEQYKILREHVKRIDSGGGSRLLAVMSPIKGDGKSTVAANLAAVLALEYEQQVLLIDADLRSPSIHHFFGLSSTPGLADYLDSSSNTNISQYAHKTSLPGLRVVPAGRPTHASSELLATDRMKSLLRDLPINFPGYQVIFDTSPVLSTSDPLVLAEQVDNILIVVRAGATPRDCLLEALKSLGSDRVKGIILNGTATTPSSKYYYYYGQQS
jgi:capsular exopolysaccharide synthesis family protein